MSEPWKPRKAKLPWRDFLTLEERDKIAASDEARRHWKELSKERAAITNRAIQRAKHAAIRALTVKQEADDGGR